MVGGLQEPSGGLEDQPQVMQVGSRPKVMLEIGLGMTLPWTPVTLPSVLEAAAVPGAAGFHTIPCLHIPSFRGSLKYAPLQTARKAEKVVSSISSLRLLRLGIPPGPRRRSRPGQLK